MEIKTNDYVRGILIADCSRRHINNRLLTAMTSHRIILHEMDSSRSALERDGGETPPLRQTNPRLVQDGGEVEAEGAIDR